MNTPNKIFKVAVLGAENTGKTSLVVRAVNDKFIVDYKPTRGVDFLIKELNINDKIINLQLWDSAGHTQFNFMKNVILDGSAAVIYVADLTRKETLDKLYSDKNPLIEYNKELNKTYNLCTEVLVLTKNDIYNENDENAIKSEMINDFLDKTGVSKFYYTSAKTGWGINDLFEDLTFCILEKNRK